MTALVGVHLHMGGCTAAAVAGERGQMCVIKCTSMRSRTDGKRKEGRAPQNTVPPPTYCNSFISVCTFVLDILNYQRGKKR